MTDAKLKAALTLTREGTSRIGRDRILLLQAVAEHGSIAAAARSVGLSYKAAWDGIGTLNNLFPQPVVTATPGGKSGGGAEVTPAGHALIASFNRVENVLTRAFAKLDAELADLSLSSSNIVRSLTMQTSTRNAFLCTVTGVTEGAVNSVVEMKLTDGQILTAVITERSATDMGIREGTEVYALIKAPFIILAAGELTTPVSARNVVTGTVASREDGAVNSEIILDIGDGKTVTSIVTIASAKALDLKPGDVATAMFKASHVIVALP
ncbi:TOBE domain-containing protein [Tropicimonas sp. IMCC34043]|uniref:TOBE domain-containing protein n=1 Tax=Tropicimonas sp. IMCC34043 TaxID=2248760 RepID=UPI000E24F8F3|nr:TOBE domain-containing protein [Tropicimonas sp. IMCC34043]